MKDEKKKNNKEIRKIQKMKIKQKKMEMMMIKYSVEKKTMSNMISITIKNK